jgi:hypothetical protein
MIVDNQNYIVNNQGNKYGGGLPTFLLGELMFTR